MSVFSKIFILINLLLTLLLVGVMGTLLSQKADYRSAYETAHGDLRGLLVERRELDREFEASLASLGQEDQRTTRALAERQAALQQSRTQRTRQEESINAGRQRRGKLNTMIRKTDKAYADLTGELRDQIEQLEQARAGRTHQVRRMQATQNRLHGRTVRLDEAQDRLATLQRDRTQLGEQRRRAIHVIKQAHEQGIEIPTDIFPKLNGIIERVVPQTALVMISLGSNERVRKGMRFHVERGSRYIGMIKVIAVFRNMASARALSAPFRAAPVLRQGDRIISTRGQGNWK